MITLLLLAHAAYGCRWQKCDALFSQCQKEEQGTTEDLLKVIRNDLGKGAIKWDCKGEEPVGHKALPSKHPNKG